jgi:hypothetical protein
MMRPKFDWGQLAWNIVMVLMAVFVLMAFVSLATWQMPLAT